MPGNRRRTRKNDTQGAQSQGNGAGNSPRASVASASPLNGNALPAPREEAGPALPEEEQPGRPLELARVLPSDHDTGDFLQLSITNTRDGKSYSLRGFKGAIRAVSHLILCVGFTIALTGASIVAVPYMLAPGPVREKVYSGLAVVATTTVVLVGSRAKRWLTGWIKRLLRRHRN